jgi:4-diphosphocytidyl-2C-methyl-D-erythritol kinase
VLLRLPGVRGGAGILLVTPAPRLSTADVFAAYDSMGPVQTGASSALLIDEVAAAFADGIDGAGLASLGPRLRDANDLWRAAASLAPGLDDLRGGLERLLDRPVLLSGSGSTLFALYASEDEARSAAESLAAADVALPEGTRLAAAGVEIDQPPWRFP